MHTDLPGSQNRPFSAPRANSPCRIAYIRAPFWASPGCYGRSACFSHPVQMSQRGARAAAVKACLVIHNDEDGCVPTEPAETSPVASAVYILASRALDAGADAALHQPPQACHCCSHIRGRGPKVEEGRASPAISGACCRHTGDCQIGRKAAEDCACGGCCTGRRTGRHTCTSFAAFAEAALYPAHCDCREGAG